MTSEPLTTCLWFDDQAEEAARFYTSVFKDAAMGDIHRYTEAGPGKAGTVMLVEFELNGQKFTGLNGGPQPFGFNEAVSFCVTCADQAEVDYYWEGCSPAAGSPASAGGSKTGSACAGRSCPGCSTRWCATRTRLGRPG